MTPLEFITLAVSPVLTVAFMFGISDLIDRIERNRDKKWYS